MHHGGSATAEAFDATIQVARPSAGLALVTAHSGSPEGLVLAHDGRIVTRLADPRTLLALLSFEATSALAAHPQIARAGQVSIDPARFAQFVALAGLDDTTNERH